MENVEKFEQEYVEINDLIAEMMEKVETAEDDGQREIYIRQLETLQRIRRENYAKSDKEREERDRKFERKLKIIKMVLDGLGIIVPIAVTGFGVYIARKNLVDLLQYELTGHVTSAAGKVLIPNALKIKV